jgi:hypothetical protein
MGTQAYPRLSIETFGAHLLDTEDLDPIYVALHRCRTDFGWPEEQIARWLVAYWCFYDAGVACWMAEEGLPFWEWMVTAATNEKPSPVGRWPRAKERRHFRGGKAIKAVRELEWAYPEPIRMIDRLRSVQPSIGAVMAEVKRHYLFGDWIAFKVADMLDRCLGHHINFDMGHVFMFEQPVEAAIMLWRNVNKLVDYANPRDREGVLRTVVQYLQDAFADRKAPPTRDRGINLQEIETILCKWKSHMSGHYPLWNDITEIGHSIDKWVADSELAAAFQIALPTRSES